MKSSKESTVEESGGFDMKLLITTLTIAVFLISCGHNQDDATPGGSSTPGNQNTEEKVCMSDFFNELQLKELTGLAEIIKNKSMIEQSITLAQFIINSIGEERMIKLASTGLYLDWYATKNPLTCKTIEEGNKNENP